MSRKKHKKSGPNLFSEEQLEAMTVRKHDVEYKTGIDKNGNPFRVLITRKTLADFVAEANEIWHGIYDYTDSVYKDKLSPITIYCPKHDLHFTVGMAQNHVIKPHGKGKATGCPVCSYEQQYGLQFGPEWRDTLRLSKKQNRVGRIYQPHPRNIKTPEQRAAEEAERNAKAEAKRREEQAYIDHWKAKNLKEAHFLEKLQSRYPDMYDTHLVDFKDKDNKVTLICPTHGEFRISARQLFGDARHKPHGCWQCAGLDDPDNRPAPMTADEFFQRMHQLYDATELDFLTSEFKGKNKKVTAYCRKHGAITHPADYWLEGKGCEYCNGKFYPPDFLQLARKKHGYKYQYRGIKDIKNQTSIIRIHCNNPEHHWWPQRVERHLAGDGCRECAGRHQPVMQRCQEWIDKCIEKYGEGRYDYSRAHEDYVNNDSLVWIRCCIHDHWFQTTPDNNLRTVNGSCPICSIEFRESEGEATIRRWLQKHGILDFEQEYQLPNEDPTLPLQYLSADFYLLHGRDYIIIEYHGEQHYKDIPYFYEGRVRNFAVQQQRDRYLRRYCHDNGIRLIEIPYWDFNRIDEILTDYLELEKE